MSLRQSFLLYFSLLFIFISLPLEARDFRLITYNVWGLPVPFKLDHSKLPLIAQSIPIYQPDVVVFQETFTKRAEVLKTIKGMNYFAQGPGKKGVKFQSSGLLTVSRHPIVQVKNIQYNKCAGFDCLSAKGALLTTIKLEDGTLVDIYNTHLNAGKNAKVKWSQLAQLVQFIQANDRGHPTFIAGDFNITPDSAYYEYLRKDAELVDTHAAYVVEHPDLSEKQKKGITHSKKKLLSKKTNERKLDYAFVMNSNGHQDSDVLFTQPIYDGSHDNNRFSDHFAVLLDYQLP
jgi:endonuclease/exonuclease/phosphatase family metal-dependent hydrolase